MSRRVVVTGLGFITCIGNNASEVERSLRELESGLSETVFLDNEALPVRLVGKPKEFEVEGTNWRKWSVPERYQIDPSMKRSLPPHGIYAVCAIEQALADAGLSKEQLGTGETGLYCASAGSPLLMGENLANLYETRGERGNPLGVLSSIAGTLNFNLGSWLGIKGTNCGYVSACASSTHALGYAYDDIVLGRQERAVVVGGEDPTAETLLAFLAMRALSTNPDPKSASRPFDVRRDGFVGAGGAVVLILESEEAAKARGAKVVAEFAGWGQASDGYHRASPQPEGKGLAKAMTLALKSAGIAPSDVDYVNAHATSTPAGDVAETRAIESVFADKVGEVPVSSVKGITGHSLSMAGALEAAVCCLALDRQLLIGNAHLGEVDPACSRLNLPLQSVSSKLTWVLNNSSGFGGSNVCNVFRRYLPEQN